MYVGTFPSADPHIPTPMSAAAANPGQSDDGLLLMYIYC